MSQNCFPPKKPFSVVILSSYIEENHPKNRRLKTSEADNINQLPRKPEKVSLQTDKTEHSSRNDEESENIVKLSCSRRKNMKFPRKHCMIPRITQFSHFLRKLIPQKSTKTFAGRFQYLQKGTRSVN